MRQILGNEKRSNHPNHEWTLMGEISDDCVFLKKRNREKIFNRRFHRYTHVQR